MPLARSRFLHHAQTTAILAGNAAAVLAYSVRASDPLVDAKWLAIGLAGAALIVLYAIGWARETLSTSPRQPLLGLALLALGTAVSALAAHDHASALHALPGALLPLAWGAMVITIRWSRRDLLILLGGLVALACVVAGIGILQYYTPELAEALTGFARAPARGRAAIVSTIGNPEYLAGFLAPLGVLALAATVRAHRAASTTGAAMAGVALLVIGWALLLTESRGAWLGFIVGAIFLFLLMRQTDKPAPARRGRWIGWAVGSVAAVLVLLVALPTPLNPYRVNLAGRASRLADIHSDSVQQRILLYLVAAHMIRTDGWLGVGPEAFSRRFPDALAAMRSPETEGSIERIAYRLGDRRPGYVHCDYLQFWTENGILGIAGFLWLIAASIALIWNRPLREQASDRNQFPRAAFSAAWFCGVIYCAFAFPFHSPDRILLYWTLFGLMGASFGISDEPGPRTERVPSAKQTAKRTSRPSRGR